MTTAPPIVHAITRDVTRRHLLGHLYSARCECGTTWQPTPDKDKRDAGVRRHMAYARQLEIRAAENAKRRPIKTAQKREQRARKAGAA